MLRQGVGVMAFYHMIRRLSQTLSCNKTLVINFFFFKVVIFLGYKRVACIVITEVMRTTSTKVMELLL